MNLTPHERAALEEVGRRIDLLADHLTKRPRPSDPASLADWFGYLDAMKAIVGNADNDASLVAALMAKEFLCRNLAMRPFDAAAKSQSAPGLDIDERTLEGARVTAEIKTTEPCGPRGDLGSNQKIKFREDFDKLNTADAAHRFFFVTSPRTFELMKRKYAREIPEVVVVLLPTGDTFRHQSGVL